MQWPPFTFDSISLWLAVTAIILLITVQLAQSYNGSATLLANVKRLGYVALATALLFFAIVAYALMK